MAAVGGSVESVTLNGREFAVTADADINRKLGGQEADVQANGNGTSRIIKTTVPASFTGIVVQCDDTRGDHELLQSISDGNEFVPVTITYASGETYMGTATITGELQYSSQNATCTFDVMGNARFTRQ
jgi:hypothetical protein